VISGDTQGNLLIIGLNMLPDAILPTPAKSFLRGAVAFARVCGVYHGRGLVL
jgi:hypothetical protein